MNLKTYFLTCMAMFGTFACTAFDSFQDAMKSADAKQRAKDTAGAVADYTEAVNIAKSDREKADAFLKRLVINIDSKAEEAYLEDKKALFALENTTHQRMQAYNALFEKAYNKDIVKSESLWNEIKDDAKLSVSQKIALARKYSENLFANWKISEAHAMLEALKKDEAFKEFEQNIDNARISLYMKAAEYDKAAVLQEKLFDAEVKDFSKKFTAAERLSANYLSERKFEKAVSVWKRMLETDEIKQDIVAKSRLKLGNIYFDMKDYKAARAEYLAVIDNAELKDDQKTQAKIDLIRLDLKEENLEQANADFAKYINLEADPKLSPALAAMCEIYYARRMFPEALRYMDMTKDYTLAWERSWRGQTLLADAKLRILGLMNKNAEIAAFTKTLVESKQFKPFDNARFSIIGLLAANGDIKADSEKIAKEYAISVSDYPNLIASVAKFFVSIGSNDLGRKLYDYRETLFRKGERNQLTLNYVKNAPTDVGSWMNSPLLKDLKNRADVNNPYGEKEAANLYTDVMAATRVVGDPKQQADKETYFYVCYDESGIHLFFVGVDSKVKEIMDGRMGGSGYEMYIALGENAPAYQWLFDQPGKNLYIPPWNSPHKFYRHLGEYVTIDTRPIENGIATVMTFPWELAYDRLPKNGDTWPFELIRWTRGGGVTWGGKSVWQIGNWGRLKFDGMTPEVRLAIQRRLIYKSLAKYKTQRNAGSGGLIALWADAELGDKDFSETVLTPFVAKLDELAKDVSDDMSPETIERLYVEAVPHWFDFRYSVDDLRREYLMNKQLQ